MDKNLNCGKLLSHALAPHRLQYPNSLIGLGTKLKKQPTNQSCFQVSATKTNKRNETKFHKQAIVSMPK